MNLIKEIVEKFDGTEDQIKQISEIYEKIKDKSEKLNKSRPQSVASAIVYYWILKNKKNITCKEFAEKVDLSELTINKIIKEIENILNEKM
jgi:transcription initiation factor TFIIIB Brf1 subunit/transcription initiation factor TFIIB